MRDLVRDAKHWPEKRRKKEEKVALKAQQEAAIIGEAQEHLLNRKPIENSCQVRDAVL